MGDGLLEKETDIKIAFDIQERIHMQSNRKVMIAGTSYRSVSWDKHNKEILDSGFIIENSFISKNNEYYKCMTVYLSN